MLYYVVKPLLFLTFHLYFRKVYFTNRHLIPKKNPKIFALNHPTAFMDPILLPAFCSITFHFLLRGDMFNSPFFAFLLDQLKTIPIFRQRDGFSSIKRNQSTFDKCYKILNKKGSVIILAEGTTKHEKRLRTIQKGTARLAFGTYDKYQNEEICIIPTGINYTDSNEFRSQAMVDFGAPIYIKDYLETYKENDRKAILQVTKEIQKRMYNHVIHINKEEDDDLVNGLLDINRNNRAVGALPIWERKNRKPIAEELSITNGVNEMEGIQKNELKETVQKYFNQLKTSNLKDYILSVKNYSPILSAIYLIIGFLPALAGFIFSFLPVNLAKYAADNKAKKIEFHASVRYSITLVFLFIWFLTWSIPAIISGNWLLILAVFILPFLGLYSFYYLESIDKMKQWFRLKKLAPKAKEALVDWRNELTAAANGLKV